MNNEPVAWNEEEFNHIAYSYRSWLASDPKGVSERYQELVNYVQSVAHPAKTLTISDKDILKIIHDKFTKFGFEADYIVEDIELIEFARAILRKAQEK